MGALVGPTTFCEFPENPRGGGLEPYDKNTGRPHGSCLDELRERRFGAKGCRGDKKRAPVLVWMNSVNGGLGQRVKGCSKCGDPAEMAPVFHAWEPDG